MQVRSTDVLCALMLMAIPRWALAYGAGQMGYSGKTPGQVCNLCHSGGTPPTVTITGPAMLAPGATAQYLATATVATKVVAGGLDVAVDDPNAMLATAAPLTQVKGGEITHTQALLYIRQGAQFTLSVPFKVTAPATTGTLTLYADMLAGDGIATPAGDSGSPTTFKITVGAVADGGQAADAGRLPDGGVKDGGGQDGAVVTAVDGSPPGAYDFGSVVYDFATTTPPQGDGGATSPMAKHGCSFAPGGAPSAAPIALLLSGILVLSRARSRRAFGRRSH